MLNQGALKSDGPIDRSVISDPQVAARVVAGFLLFAWAALWPFLPQDRMSEAVYWWLVRMQSFMITGLALWAFVHHLSRRRWAAAFLITPVLAFVLVVASGVVMMISAFLASGRMPI